MFYFFFLFIFIRNSTTQLTAHHTQKMHFIAISLKAKSMQLIRSKGAPRWQHITSLRSPLEDNT